MFILKKYKKEKSLGQQRGNTLAEVMAATAVVTTLITNGLGFFNASVSKAQSSQAFQASKTVSDGVKEVFARKPIACSPAGLEKQGISMLEPSGEAASLIDSAVWHSTNCVGKAGAQSGHVSVQFSAENTNDSIADEYVLYYFPSVKTKAT
jgi:hypothetical protein